MERKLTSEDEKGRYDSDCPLQLSGDTSLVVVAIVVVVVKSCL